MIGPSYDEHTGLAIVGGGPAAFGLLGQAVRQERLADLIASGVTLIERSSRPGAGSLSGYRITSNSFAEAFLEETAADLIDPAVEASSRGLEEYLGRPFPLPVAKPFLEAKATAILKRMRDCSRSVEVLLNAEAHTIRAAEGGGWSIIGKQSGASGTKPFRVKAKVVLLANGGDPQHWQEVGLFDDRRAEALPTILPITEVICADPPSLVAMFGTSRPPRPLIIGGSHSAISAAAKLHSGLGPTARITVAHRNSLRFYFLSKDHARAAGVEPLQQIVCRLSGRVNRFGGLRYDSAAFARRYGSGSHDDNRIEFHRLAELRSGRMEELDELLDRATHVVPALGFRRRPLPLFDQGGEEIRLQCAADGGLAVTSQGRLSDDRGTLLPDLFAVGLGAGLTSGSRLGGESDRPIRTDGVWMYNYDGGRAILDPLIEAIASRS